MTYKQILIPDSKNHSFEMPEKFFCKKVEVTATELENDHPSPPSATPLEPSALFENFGFAPDFPSIDSIRQKFWPSKW